MMSSFSVGELAQGLFARGLTLLAQSAAPTTGPSDADLPWWAKIIKDGGILLPALIFFFVFYFFVVRNKKKQDSERQKKLDAVTKGDQIETIGGLIGTVVSTDDKTVLLKVDENANVKMRFNRRAIHRVIEEEKPASK